MNSKTTGPFRQQYRALPADLRRAAREAYRHFAANPQHPGLDFKRLRTREPMYSARVTDNYRAVARRDGGTWIWFWIGPHAEYDRLLRRR